MDKKLQRWLFAALTCVVAALAASCSTDDEPDNEKDVVLTSFDYDFFHKSDNNYDYDYLRWITVDYSAETGVMTVRLDYADEYPFNIKGLAIAENDVISIGFSNHKWTLPVEPDCEKKASITWTLSVKGHGKRSIAIYHLQYNDVRPEMIKFWAGKPLHTVEVNLDGDVSKTFEFECRYI